MIWIIPAHEPKNVGVYNHFNQVPDISIDKYNVNPTNRCSNNENKILKRNKITWRSDIANMMKLKNWCTIIEAGKNFWFSKTSICWWNSIIDENEVRSDHDADHNYKNGIECIDPEKDCFHSFLFGAWDVTLIVNNYNVLNQWYEDSMTSCVSTSNDN